MKPVIILSAVNFTNGGPLSILVDVLDFAEKYLVTNYKVIALVHKVTLFDINHYKNIVFVEFPQSTKSYLYRLYLEYFYFRKISQKYTPKVWFSLHDTSPNVESDIQAVYCHNPAPFYKTSFLEIKLDIKFVLFNWFYKFLYLINIHKNDFVVVQQEWLREEFSKKFRLDNKNIIVSYPSITGGLIEKNKKDIPKKTIFFYPSLPRVFKNFETLIKAVKMLNEDKNLTPFEVVLTINGHENKYAEYIYTQLTGIENIKLLGLLSRSEVYSWYEKASCMVFPSKLETWGLPISEAKKFHLPIIVPDLEYAHETVGNYDHVSFFSLDDACSLAEHMKKIIKGEVSSKHRYPLPQEPFSKNWKELFEIILDSSL